MSLCQKVAHLVFVFFKGLTVWREHDDVVGIAGVDDTFIIIVAIHFFQIDIGKKWCCGCAGHHAMVFFYDLSVADGEVLGEHRLEKLV